MFFFTPHVGPRLLSDGFSFLYTQQILIDAKCAFVKQFAIPPQCVNPTSHFPGISTHSSFIFFFNKFCAIVLKLYC